MTNSAQLRYKESHSTFLNIRGLSYHVRHWGDPLGRPLLMLHGVRDCAATFQFAVDCLKSSWNIIAPDWRGHGHSEHTHQGYWSHEFVADLDEILDVFFPDIAPDVVGHSMGGNVACIYAALRPGRFRRLVLLDALGPPVHRLPVDIVKTLGDVLAASRRFQRPGSGYASLWEISERLLKANFRLTQERAAFLAKHSAGVGSDGRYRWLFDSALKHSFPSLHTLDEWSAIWRRLSCPLLWIGSCDRERGLAHFDEATLAERRLLIPNSSFLRLEETSHNLHHDQPENVATLIEDFLLRD